MKKLLFLFGFIVILFLFKYKIACFFASQNSETLLQYYEYLLKVNPEEAYKLCLKNLENKDSQAIAVSYDNLIEMTIPEAMLFYARNENAFSEEQMKYIYEWILTNLDRNQNLAGDLSLYLDENEKKPDLKYYSNIKKEIERMTKTPNDNNIIYFNYFYNYKKDEDSTLIKKYIEKAIFEENNSYNFTLEAILEHPEKQYFKIVKMYYKRKIVEKIFRSDISYFALEQFVTTLIKYQNEESKKMLNELTSSSKYETYDDKNSFSEHIYLLLNEFDSENYFSDIKIKLSDKIDKKQIQNIEDLNRRYHN